ncbi:MAG: adenylate cyclase [Deltaproteobacteria bacterium]|nr:MAG: adenylate cyclase [Deltaproteobacteria bacterium]
MAIEIERKFLVLDQSWRHGAVPVLYRQAYLAASKEVTVRVRLAGDSGFLTIKGGGNSCSRLEFEYAIPAAEAAEMLETLCPGPHIEKNRFSLKHQGFSWVVDEFLGANHGLVIAEIELEHASQAFIRPPWLGREVTGDSRYYNACLARTPFCDWAQESR